MLTVWEIPLPTLPYPTAIRIYDRDGIRLNNQDMIEMGMIYPKPVISLILRRIDFVID